MKDKFIRIISPLTVLIICALDAGVIAYGIFAVKQMTERMTTSVILFAALDLVAVIIAVLVTKEVFSNGVKFYDDECEFTALDENNIFTYNDIASVEYTKDEAPSFTKNFADRNSVLTINLKNDSFVSIDLGYTSKGSVEKVVEEIKNRIDN